MRQEHHPNSAPVRNIAWPTRAKMIETRERTSLFPRRSNDVSAHCPDRSNPAIIPPPPGMSTTSRVSPCASSQRRMLRASFSTQSVSSLTAHASTKRQNVTRSCLFSGEVQAGHVCSEQVSYLVAKQPLPQYRTRHSERVGHCIASAEDDRGVADPYSIQLLQAWTHNTLAMWVPGIL
eukprot:864229-Rhodomonas_salina.2